MKQIIPHEMEQSKRVSVCNCKRRMDRGALKLWSQNQLPKKKGKKMVALALKFNEGKRLPKNNWATHMALFMLCREDKNPRWTHAAITMFEKLTIKFTTC